MRAKLDEVRELGAATAEEWFKGLEIDGKEKAADTARWEHWEAAGGFQAIAHGAPDYKPLQRPDHEPHDHSSTGPSPSGFGTATANTLENTRPSQAHPWATQGMRIYCKPAFLRFRCLVLTAAQLLSLRCLLSRQFPSPSMDWHTLAPYQVPLCRQQSPI